MSDAPLPSTAMVVATRDALAAEFGDELVLLNAATGVYYGLEQVGARIWSLLKEPTTIEAILDVITSEYDVDAAECERDVAELLARLKSVGLVDVQRDPEDRTR